MNLNSIVISVNLPGELEGNVKHLSIQSYSVKVFTKDQKHLLITKDILHTDRKPTKCTRIINIPSAVVSSWIKSECPFWIYPKIWKVLSKEQKISTYVSRFDEGHGVSYV